LDSKAISHVPKVGGWQASQRGDERRREQKKKQTGHPIRSLSQEEERGEVFLDASKEESLTQ
jgi:hypothetical protein